MTPNNTATAMKRVKEGKRDMDGIVEQTSGLVVSLNNSLSLSSSSISSME